MISFPLLWISILPAIMGGYVPPGPRFRCPNEPKYIYPCACARGSDRGLYIRCENTNLASLSLAFSNLGNEGAPIEELVLYKCNIGKRVAFHWELLKLDPRSWWWCRIVGRWFEGRFYGPALYPLDVRVLKFVDTPLRLIEEHSFLGVNRTLQELHVINSILEKFPHEALQILGNLSILSITGHRISTLPANSFAESAAAAKIEKLEISNGTCRYLFLSRKYAFPESRILLHPAIFLSSVGTLSSLPVEALAPLKKLKRLDMHGNKIKELKRNQFKGLRDTEYLDLSHNLISKLDGSHLADLTKMGWCNMSHNAIADLKR